jgi:3-oxoacyl-[acyl-carrier protein] reductase
LTRKSLSDDQMVELGKQVPVGRFAHPEEISRIVVFLASDLNTYITGQNIIVDGGFTSV